MISCGNPARPLDAILGNQLGLQENPDHACLRNVETAGAFMIPITGEEDFGEMMKDHLAAVNKDLATTDERLAHYEAQVGRQN